jgi:hypothetical protein
MPRHPPVGLPKDEKLCYLPCMLCNGWMVNYMHKHLKHYHKLPRAEAEPVVKEGYNVWMKSDMIQRVLKAASASKGNPLPSSDSTCDVEPAK